MVEWRLLWNSVPDDGSGEESLSRILYIERGWTILFGYTVQILAFFYCETLHSRWVSRRQECKTGVRRKIVRGGLVVQRCQTGRAVQKSRWSRRSFSIRSYHHSCVRNLLRHLLWSQTGSMQLTSKVNSSRTGNVSTSKQTDSICCRANPYRVRFLWNDTTWIQNLCKRSRAGRPGEDARNNRSEEDFLCTVAALCVGTVCYLI